MGIEEKDVEHVANLARIALTPQERKASIKEFTSIIELFEKLDDIEEDIEPTFHVLPIENVFRDDEAGECMTIEEALANAPRKEDGYFRGPRIV